MKKMPLANMLMLLGAALIWGTAFVAQSLGMNYVGPVTFNGLRYFLGAAVLLPMIIYRRRKEAPENAGRNVPVRPWPVMGSLCCGFFLFAASTMQQIGIVTTDVGKACFITALYIVLVPLLNLAVTRKTSLRLWAGVVLACAGLYLLSITDGLHLEPGDRSLLLCAVLFAFQIMSVDHFAPGADSLELACGQFTVAGILGTTAALLTEEISLSALAAGILPLLYVGVFSSGIAYTLQIAGQKNADPSVASLIMSLESVISAAAGYLFLHQVLTSRETAGCVLMFAAIILVQLPAPRRGLVGKEESGI